MAHSIKNICNACIIELYNTMNRDIHSAQKKFALYLNFYYHSIDIEIEDE